MAPAYWSRRCVTISAVDVLQQQTQVVMSSRVQLQLPVPQPALQVPLQLSQTLTQLSVQAHPVSISLVFPVPPRATWRTPD